MNKLQRHSIDSDFAAGRVTLEQARKWIAELVEQIDEVEKAHKALAEDYKQSNAVIRAMENAIFHVEEILCNNSGYTFYGGSCMTCISGGDRPCGKCETTRTKQWQFDFERFKVE